MTVLVPHDPGCRWARQDSGGHSDAASRISDWYNLHRTHAGTDAIGRFMACAIADGSSDGTLYATKREAVRHQHHNERFYCFIAIGPQSMSVCSAESLLKMFRQTYDAGIHLVDPDHKGGGRDIIRRLTTEDHRSQMRSITMAGFIRPSNIWLPGDDK